MNNIIEVSSLKKSYGDVQAVKGIDFSVQQGTLFAFLGENGAGKSTTIDMLCTLLKPDGGNVTIDGFTLGADDEKIRNTIGIVFQDSLLDPLLTVHENLIVRESFYGKSRAELKQAVERAAAIVDATEFLHRAYGMLSGGQRRRADIARALVHTPKILFLDEPTTGLDPYSRRKVWETIKNLQTETGLTVFLTTHYMEEASQADYITIMGKGEILAKGTSIDLKQKYSSDLLKIKPKEKELLRAQFKQNQIMFQDKGETFHIPLTSTVEAIPLLKLYEDYIANVEVVNGTMDDVFIHVTGTEVQV
ncbi:ABC transporter [Desulfuribacillus stibiiarsenatis]|uniref:ABC transporter n=1 Tax=Desulfuribacillus stibiiarsenatis TaxID=1390249 RepID=A0A1E5L1X9_9FIRM|nr:ATP-binding cassette domain-containing protein [Desulfuribacillus stibiiarsenatis]OEH84158.1 ABC transporter [Desulfuribacillus stibiiarsenatis]